MATGSVMIPPKFVTKPAVLAFAICQAVDSVLEIHLTPKIVVHKLLNAVGAWYPFDGLIVHPVQGGQHDRQWL